MTDYTELVKALRCELHYTSCPETNCKYIFNDTFCDTDRLMIDAAAAIEALQAEVDTLKLTDSKRCQECLYLGQPVGEQLIPKRGKWILCGQVGWPKWECSVCHSEGRGDYMRCPWCGAVMDESNDSNASNASNALNNAQDGPIITPCRGCSDYDGYGGCKSKGGCARKKMEVQK